MRLGLVYAGIVLGSQKNLAIGGQGLFQSAYAGLTANYEWSHHMREDDHITDGHHRKLASLKFLFTLGHVFAFESCPRQRFKSILNVRISRLASIVGESTLVSYLNYQRNQGFGAVIFVACS